MKNHERREVQTLRGCVGRIDICRDPDGRVYLSCVPVSRTRRFLAFAKRLFDSVDWWETALHLFDTIAFGFMMMGLVGLTVVLTDGVNFW